jgi:hypothetical protein
VVDIEQTLKKLEGGKLNNAAKWVTGMKSGVVKLQLGLEIALDEIKADT